MKYYEGMRSSEVYQARLATASPDARCYFWTAAESIHSYLADRSALTRDQLILEEQQYIDTMVRQLNETCPFIGRLIRISGGFHGVVNNDTYNQEFYPTSESGVHIGRLKGFSLQRPRIRRPDERYCRLISLSLLIRTQVDDGPGKTKDLVTPLRKEIGSAHPLLAELN